MAAANTLAGVTGTISSLTSLAASVAALNAGPYAGTLWEMGAWAQGMRVASWRGLPFAVRESTIRKGRRNALHVYPYRDEIWAEDLGRGVRHYSFRGFLVGDDVLEQSLRMQEAAERFGPGTLVHPALGALNCSVVEFAARQDAERGRVIEIEFSVVETSSAMYPALVESTQQGVQTQAQSAFAAIAADFQNDVVAPLAEGASVVAKVGATVGTWAGIATKAVGDASLIARAVSGMQGNYGRYSSGSMTGVQSASVTVVGLLGLATTARTALSTVAASAQTLASAL